MIHMVTGVYFGIDLSAKKRILKLLRHFIYYKKDVHAKKVKTMVDVTNVMGSGPKVTRPNYTNATSEKQIDDYFDLANPDAKWRNIKIIGVGLMNTILIGIMFANFRFAYIQDPTWTIVLAIGTAILVFSTMILLLKKNSNYRFLTYCIDIFGLIAALSIYLPIVILPIIITIVFMIDVFSTDFALQPQGIANNNVETDERVE